MDEITIFIINILVKIIGIIIVITLIFVVGIIELSL